MKKLLLFIFGLSFATVAFSQVTASDCSQAVNVCTNLSFSIDPNGFGAVNEIPPIGSVGNPLNNNPGGSGNLGCLQSGETNSTWMIINISGSGNLEFNFGGTSQAGYYDWAMWPYSATACASIPGGNFAPVRCNWNGVSTGGTGLASTLTGSMDPSNFEPPLAVTCGQQFIICFSNWSSVTTTVPLQFGGTATVSCATVIPPISVNNATICPGATATLTASGGTTYTWNPGGLTGNPVNVSPATTTTYTVTSNTACGISTSTATVTVLSAADPSCGCTVTAGNGGPYCVGGTIALTATNVAGATGYSWVGPNSFSSTTQNPTIPGATAAAAGVYTVTVTTPGGTCTSTTTVAMNALPTPTASNTGPYCEGATIQLNSPAGSATDDWAGPGGYNQANTQNPTRPGATAAMAGVYTVTVTNGAGCSATATTTVVVNPLPTPTATNTGPYCVGQTIQINSPSGSATDDWAGPGGYTQANTQNPTRPGATVAMGGVYTVTVTNAFGCSATATTTVVVNPLPTPTASNTGPYCFGQTIQLNSPTGSATDDWTGPSTYAQNNVQNPTIVGATAANAGVYTVTVTSAAGCSATATTTVAVNPLPTPTASNTGPYCAGATIQLNSPTGSGTDDWAGPGGYTQSNTQNPTRPGATAAMAGVYTVTVTNASGCSATATTTVVVNPLPTPTATNTGPYCAGATIQLNSPTGSGTDDWTGPATYSVNNVQNPTIGSSTIANSGVYTVTVTDLNGCSATATTTVVVNPLPTPTATNTGPYCPGALIQLNSPSGSATDDWTGPGGYTQNNTQNPTIAGASAVNAGVYTVTVTSAAGCSATATTTVVVNTGASASANNTGPYCAGATISLTSPAGAIDYDWTGPGGYSQNNTQNPTIAGSTAVNAGVYTVTITMPGGCTGTGTTTVVVNPLPTPTANNTGPYCVGATIQLNSPTGSGTDDWAGPSSYSQNDVQNPTIVSASMANAGVYTVTVTDLNGCSATATTTVVVNVLPTPTANNTGPYCAGTTIQLNSPTGSATDDWAGPGGYSQANTQNPTRPGATAAMGGVYTVTVTNVSGCSATATTTVVVNPLPTPTANNTGPYCVGNTIQLNSPTGSGTDDWTGPGGYVQNNTQNPTRIGATLAMAGVYTVTVTDLNGCSATATTTVIVNPLPTPTANNTGPYCSGSTIQLNSPTGSGTDDWAGPLLYATTNTQNPTILSSTVAMSGVYTVTVTDLNGCSATATTTVVVNGPPTPTANNTGPYCVGATIQLNSPTGSGTDDWTGPSAYSQNDIQNPALAGATLANGGIYTVTVTDINGCFATATTTVVINPLPTPTANNTGPYCVGANIQLNSPTGSGTDDWTGPSAYAQNDVQNPTIVSATAVMAGVYTVSVTDANGCNATATTTVVINALPTPLAGNTGPYCDGATMDLTSSGGVDYDWTGPGGFALANTQNGSIPGVNPGMSGTYTVSVTDANGCNSMTTTVVTINGLPTAVAGNNTPICEFQDLNLTSGGGVNYDWSGPGAYSVTNTQNPTIVSAPMSVAGIYTVTVTDANGCVSTATTDVVINPNLVFTAGSNSAICSGTQLDLNAQNIPGANYNWAGPNGFTAVNNQNPSIPGATVLASGIYTVLATNAAGCTGTATVNVLVNPLPTPVFAGDILSGCAPLCVNFTDQSIGNGGTISSWSWDVETQTNSTTQNVNYCFMNPGIYDATLTVTTTDGCSASLTVPNYITVNSNPVAEFMFTPQEIDESDPQVTFASTSSGATSWLWDFGDGGNSVLENPIHNYADTGTFCILLTVANNAGCIDTALGCLHISPVFSLFIPNAFTVNDDGLNETWNIYGRGIKTVSVRIFDRWGEEIYYFDTLDKGWPGTKQNGQECKQDVYVYRIEVVDGKNDFHEFMGSVTLIK